jgi:hypothetical protein
MRKEKMRVRFKNTKKLHLVQLFVNNALEYMNIADLEHTNLNIRFVKCLDGGATHGYCSGDIDEVDIKIATNVPFLMQLRALAHELIHARQFWAGELSPDLCAYKGVDHTNTEYENQPWEIEAHKYEDQLFMAAFPWAYDV